MAFWQYPWHITVARLRRTSTGFPCSACSPQATKPICSFQAKEKATQADFCQCDRMFSHPAFLHPISGMRSGFSHGRYSGSAHLRGESLLRLYPAFSGCPNDRISPRIQASALTATGIARISTGSLISTPELSQPTQDMGHHAAIELLKYVLLCHGSFHFFLFQGSRSRCPHLLPDFIDICYCLFLPSYHNFICKATKALLIKTPPTTDSSASLSTANVSFVPQHKTPRTTLERYTSI